MKNIVLGIVVWTFIVLALVIGWLLVPATFWQYLFFLRVPILMGLLLLILPAIAKFILPGMLKNLFVLRGIWQLTQVASYKKVPLFKYKELNFCA
jgi:hypothetical protein